MEIYKMGSKHFNIFFLQMNSSPLTFNVPTEYPKLCIEHTKRKSRAFWSFWDRAHYIGTPLHKPVDIEAQPIWICKPVGKSQGKGITVFDVRILQHNFISWLKSPGIWLMDAWLNIILDGDQLDLQFALSGSRVHYQTSSDWELQMGSSNLRLHCLYPPPRLLRLPRRSRPICHQSIWS